MAQKVILACALDLDSQSASACAKATKQKQAWFAQSANDEDIQQDHLAVPILSFLILKSRISSCHRSLPISHYSLTTLFL